ncbi:MAG: Coq4 family protein [Rhodospirillales bacterium]
MGKTAEREGFERSAAYGERAGQTIGLARAAKNDPGAVRGLAACLAHAAFAAPDRIAEIYDEAAEGWLGRPVAAPPIPAEAAGPEALWEPFWEDFWKLVDDAAHFMGAAEITTRTASLASLLSPGFQARAAAACRRYPGVNEAARSGFPPRLKMEDLAAAPEGSLGHELYRLIVDNGYDLEVLDRDTLQLARLAPPLDYLNARILQSHDLWHIVAGYRTTKLHEIALSAFQLAQFGHNYSAMFLAVVVTTAAFRTPAALTLLLDTIFSAWTHGRETPPLMGIEWEREWHSPTAAIRELHGITPYASPYPAEIIEMFEAA